MSNMKNLLGDMDFEEIEEFLDKDASSFTENDKEKFIKVWEKCGGNIHDYWMNENGRALAKAWVTTHGNFITEEYIKAFTVYMADCFSHWIFGELKKR